MNFTTREEYIISLRKRLIVWLLTKYDDKKNQVVFHTTSLSDVASDIT